MHRIPQSPKDIYGHTNNKKEFGAHDVGLRHAGYTLRDLKDLLNFEEVASEELTFRNLICENLRIRHAFTYQTKKSRIVVTRNTRKTE